MIDAEGLRPLWGDLAGPTLRIRNPPLFQRCSTEAVVAPSLEKFRRQLKSSSCLGLGWFSLGFSFETRYPTTLSLTLAPRPHLAVVTLSLIASSPAVHSDRHRSPPATLLGSCYFLPFAITSYHSFSLSPRPCPFLALCKISACVLSLIHI